MYEISSDINTLVEINPTFFFLQTKKNVDLATESIILFKQIATGQSGPN